MKEFEQKVKDGEEKAASLGPELVEKVLECAKLKEAKNKKATAVEHLNEAGKELIQRQVQQHWGSR